MFITADLITLMKQIHIYLHVPHVKYYILIYRSGKLAA